MGTRTLSKGDVPIPYIIAFVFAITVVGIIGYYFFYISGKSSSTGLEAICENNRRLYCNSLIYGGTETWKASCGIAPTLDECLAGNYGGSGGGGGGVGTYTCQNYPNQACKAVCDTERDAGIANVGTCPPGQVCCLAKPASPGG